MYSVHTSTYNSLGFQMLESSSPARAAPTVVAAALCHTVAELRLATRRLGQNERLGDSATRRLGPHLVACRFAGMRAGVGLAAEASTCRHAQHATKPSCREPVLVVRQGRTRAGSGLKLFVTCCCRCTMRLQGPKYLRLMCRASGYALHDTPAGLKHLHYQSKHFELVGIARRRKLLATCCHHFAARVNVEKLLSSCRL
jgi:hypothetical protein